MFFPFCLCLPFIDLTSGLERRLKERKREREKELLESKENTHIHTTHSSKVVDVVRYHIIPSDHIDRVSIRHMAASYLKKEQGKNYYGWVVVRMKDRQTERENRVCFVSTHTHRLLCESVDQPSYE